MDERRAWPRLMPKNRTPLRLAAPDGAESRAAVVWDVSRGGFRLLTTRPLESDLMVLELADDRVVIARKLRAEENHDGTWQLGCAVLGELDPEDLGRLVS